MSTTGGGWPDGCFSRRALLRWLARGGAAVGVLLPGYGRSDADRKRLEPALSALRSQMEAEARRGTAPGAAGVPELVAGATRATRDGTQVFKSRLDLHPPTITMHIPAGVTAAPGLVLTNSLVGPGQQGALIIDGNGELVWFFPVPAASNVRVQSYRHEPVLTWFEGTIVSQHGEGHYELYDSSYREVAQVHASGGYQGDLHDFLLTEAGSALFTCYGQATGDLSSESGSSAGAYYYGVVQEVDVASGRLLFEWRSDEHVGFDESYVARPASPGTPWDYFHINSIDVDPTDGNLIVSSRNTWAVYKIDRTSGEVLWRLGGKSDDFIMGAGAHFAFQHDARRHPDGTLSLFDDEAGPPNEASQSRGLVLAVDEKSRKAALVKQYFHSPPLLSQVLGSMQDLGQGHHFVGWGQSSWFTEFDGAGRAVLDGRLGSSSSSYRAVKQPWQGRPTAPPDIAVAGGQRAATVYASWNGATAVVWWSVIGGADRQRLGPLGTARRAGFETAITVPNPPAYLAVEALDGAGAVLGRSNVRPLAHGDSD